MKFLALLLLLAIGWAAAGAPGLCWAQCCNGL
jgi:hypothetical protein